MMAALLNFNRVRHNHPRRPRAEQIGGRSGIAALEGGFSVHLPSFAGLRRLAFLFAAAALREVAAILVAVSLPSLKKLNAAAIRCEVRAADILIRERQR
jgi:hypothetical protein